MEENMINTEVMDNEAVEVETEKGFDYAGAGTLGLALVGAGTVVYGLYKGTKKVFSWAKGKISDAKAKKASESDDTVKSEPVETEE